MPNTIQLIDQVSKSDLRQLGARRWSRTSSKKTNIFVVVLVETKTELKGRWVFNLMMLCLWGRFALKWPKKYIHATHFLRNYISLSFSHTNTLWPILWTQSCILMPTCECFPGGSYLVWWSWTQAHSPNDPWWWIHWRCTLPRDSGSLARRRFHQLGQTLPGSFLAGRWLACWSPCSLWCLQTVGRVKK